jgi:SAM-dependent methyltransferase
LRAAFFCYYASLVHQQNMLQDLVRTGAYRSAILGNGVDFKDKVVVDVGTGSGVLAYFAVQAGARHVYALEASGVARRARKLLEANGLGDRITVLQVKVEECELPEQADVIISEPMGFMLIHERMLESYIIARNRFLKPGGRMFPATGTIHCAPFSDATLHAEQLEKVAFWRTRDFFGLDLSPLVEDAERDHFGQPVVGFVDVGTLLAPTTATHGINFEADTPASLATAGLGALPPAQAALQLDLSVAAQVGALAQAALPMPGHPELGGTYLARGLLAAIGKYPWSPTPAASPARPRATMALLPLPQGWLEDPPPYAPIPGVDSNAVLYAGDGEYHASVAALHRSVLETACAQVGEAAEGGDKGVALDVLLELLEAPFLRRALGCDPGCRDCLLRAAQIMRGLAPAHPLLAEALA